jgi:hypothetical protein
MGLDVARKEVSAMSSSLRRSGVSWTGLLVVLLGVTVIPLGCGSSPTALQEGGGSGEATNQIAQAPAADPGAEAELGAPEGGPAEAGDEPAPPVAEAPSSGGTAADSAAPPEPVAAADEGPPPDAADDTSPPAAADEGSGEGEELAAAAVAAAAAVPATDWVGSAQKWVPIFSLESEGVYLGAAQVAGPASQVGKVKGVAELRLRFKRIGRIYAYVPVSTISLTKLDRVQGVSVWAVGDLELVDL